MKMCYSKFVDKRNSARNGSNLGDVCYTVTDERQSGWYDSKYQTLIKTHRVRYCQTLAQPWKRTTPHIDIIKKEIKHSFGMEGGTYLLTIVIDKVVLPFRVTYRKVFLVAVRRAKFSVPYCIYSPWQYPASLYTSFAKKTYSSKEGDAYLNSCNRTRKKQKKKRDCWTW